MTIDNHRLDDNRPYLYKTSDYGRSWRALHQKLPDDVYLHVVREDPSRRGQLYVGTERGVMFSSDDGATWRSLRLNMPTVAVHDLAVKGDDLVVGTHGRSIYILDDLQPLREFESKVAASSVHLFPVQNATRWQLGSDSWASSYGRFSNPPRGASIYYFVKEKPKGELTVEILDRSNRVVKTMSSLPRESDRSDDEDDAEALKKAALAVDAGIHRAEWDLTWEGAKKIKGAKIDFGNPSEGPQAVPGNYVVRLTVDGTVRTSPLEVVMDPRGGPSQADLEAQLAFSLRVRDTISRISTLVMSLHSVKEQLGARTRALGPRKSESAVAEVLQASRSLVEKMDALEARLHNPTAEVTYDILAQQGGAQLYSRLSPLQMWTVNGDGRPTQGMEQVMAGFEKELAPLEREAQTLLDEELTSLNDKARAAGISFVVR